MIIRCIVPPDDNKKGVQDLFLSIVRDIADNEFTSIPRIFTPMKELNCYMAVLIDGISELPFESYPCKEIIKKYIHQ